MFKAARLSKIKEIIVDKNQVDVVTLSKLLNVSNVTIRNDLEVLENEGFLLRTHGGAVLRTEEPEPAVIAALDITPEIKQIAEVAAHLIEDDVWIFLGSGNTCAAIAHTLLDRSGVNVVTNSLDVANILSRNSAANVIVSGGNLVHGARLMAGDYLRNALHNIFVERAFFGISGIDLERGLFVSSSAEYGVFQIIRELAKEIIVVAGPEKFGKLSLSSIGPLKTADAMISTSDMPEPYKERFYELGVKVFTSYDIKPSQLRGDL